MLKAYDNFIKLAMQVGIEKSQDLSRLKKDLCKKLGVQPPTNADMREHYEKLIARNEIKRNLNFEKILFCKRVRTQSGVAVVAVLTKPYPCPGKCIYCPSEKEMPKSYLANEPAVMRAISAKFSPYVQVTRRLRALELNGHKVDKVELIVMGGTFSYFPKKYQNWFVTECFRACNDYDHIAYNMKHTTKNAGTHTLAKEQGENEKAKHRVIGLTLETRPDYIDEKEIINFRKLGCTRVELGVQSIFDDVLEINRRGHTVQKTIEATRLLKDAGFKINYHIMPGLPGSDLKRDYQMFRVLFSNPDFQPDMLKIYPTVVTKNTALHRLFQKGKYIPLDDKEFAKFILRLKKNIIPPYVRIARLVRDVPAESILAGPTISNLRQMIEKKSACQCIRCREVRSEYLEEEEIILNRVDYNASGGKEIFLEYVTKNKKKLFALLRLRIPSDYAQESISSPKKPKVKKLKSSPCAIIREVHTYGKLTSINKSSKNSPQHIGLGKKLILEAEKIARNEFNCKKISVISGIGAREYYRKLGYRLKDSYMLKYL